MTIHEAFTAWAENIRPHVVAQYSETDRPALSEIWKDYTDSLCKDGELTDLQYHYCPAYDDTIPEDEDTEREYILNALGVYITAEQIHSRGDEFSAEWGKDATHWRVTLSRMPSMREPMVFTYSMGAALSGKPDRLGVVNCLVSDWQLVAGADDFEEYCAETGADADSRKAERQYNAIQTQNADFSAMFSDISLDDLAALFADY